MIALLEPSIYELTDAEIELNESQRKSAEIQHMEFLKNTLNFLLPFSVEKILQISVTNKQFELLCNPYNHPWNQYKYLTKKEELMILYSKIMKLRPHVEKNISDIEAIPLKTMNKYSLSDCYTDYCRHIALYIKLHNYYVFYGRLNCFPGKNVIYKFNGVDYKVRPIYSVNDFFNDEIREIILMQPKYQIKPDINNPLPNKEICEIYLKIQQDAVNAGEDKISTYVKIGTEVALRNNYDIDKHLINLNNGRHIFTNKYCKIHLSIDVRHGNLEVYNSFGEHQDEFTYDNKPQHKQDKTGKHDIKV